MITSTPSGGVDPAVVDGEAVREEERRARLEVRRDLVAEERGLRAVRDEHRHDLRARTASATSLHRQARLLGGRARGAVGPQADHDLDAGVGEVERVRVALAAVAEHRDLSRQETRRPPS